MTSPSPVEVLTPRVVDNDRDEITVTLGGKEIRGWSYETEADRRVKMLAAREFCEGWHAAGTSQALRVKFINWRDMTYNGVEEWVGHCALSQSFSIKDEGSQPEYRFVVRPFLSDRTSFPTAEEAKAAAQADYVRRILSALQPLPRALDLARQKEAGGNV